MNLLLSGNHGRTRSMHWRGHCCGRGNGLGFVARLLDVERLRQLRAVAVDRDRLQAEAEGSGHAERPVPGEACVVIEREPWHIERADTGARGRLHDHGSRRRERFPRSAALIYATFDLGVLCYWLIPTAPTSTTPAMAAAQTRRRFQEGGRERLGMGLRYAGPSLAAGRGALRGAP